eukprot:CAMPEP_0175964342 /NCGR_PEP_ID=MMETSP0108-20121206/37504_1 /TAXON_ID=195067 ORGANISM="Goniomonas pacifica, Strain CCMP1869" /NCGR_SAMPLE_ID=MMETSP0108 /ASSEMBLY_ACC=CAM_ASM_000204 /LENGTH=249 /DNA_ID=CAMNT_0017292305 /DNA_START=18 /DNA_END=767 /DNA_ORIENTATION=-
MSSVQRDLPTSEAFFCGSPSLMMQRPLSFELVLSENVVMDRRSPHVGCLCYVHGCGLKSVCHGRDMGTFDVCVTKLSPPVVGSLCSVAGGKDGGAQGLLVREEVILSSDKEICEVLEAGNPDWEVRDAGRDDLSHPVVRYTSEESEPSLQTLPVQATEDRSCGGVDGGVEEGEWVHGRAKLLLSLVPTMGTDEKRATEVDPDSAAVAVDANVVLPQPNDVPVGQPDIDDESFTQRGGTLFFTDASAHVM